VEIEYVKVHMGKPHTVVPKIVQFVGINFVHRWKTQLLVLLIVPIFVETLTVKQEKTEVHVPQIVDKSYL